ncbi:MAG TPA: sel1 repeat family protein [Xanthobacteraceae bacterium]|nr:sel1 repeat family protein [Xanthobacteraceae bacterium]
MARYEMATLESAAAGQGNSAGDIFFQLGIMCSAGGGDPVDRVAAHKWFNLAAARGNRLAAEHRQELAAEMNTYEIATAQRAAREWLTTH